MRLLYRDGDRLAFTTRPERYAILSHTWSDNEITYDDIFAGRTGPKIEFTLQQAERDKIRYVWIDSCCIDRRNNTELGEAINLMFKWYADAEVCYAYLMDVPEKSFVASRWHTRGWTLQELLAPKEVQFYDGTGAYIGNKASLASDILIASGIEDVPLHQVPLADRLRWAEKRQTTKPEDASYCMLGLMEVSLLFNYGEGAAAARLRLLDAVRQHHGDRTGASLLLPTPSNPCDSVKSLQKALSFDGMFLRHQAISEAYRGTCEWLFDVPYYKEWLAGERHMIWIKGHPGSGKSTLLKHIEDRAPGISFYFNARGGSLEHSVPGMFRSLLHQLIDQENIGEQVLTYVRKQIRKRLPWLSQLSLQQTFRHAVSLIKPLRCYIDALDECDQQEVQQMVQLLEDSGLYVCFASRHYPAIVINSVSIEMAGSADIAIYVHGRIKPDLAEEVIWKANGIFFWATLVVDMLNKGHVQGRKKAIDALPGTLDGLLKGVIQARENRERFDLAMCLVLFQQSDPKRPPLSPMEFCDLLRADTSDEVDDEALYIADSSRGLAEIADDRIQLVHETVREVMLKTWTGEHVDVSGWAHNNVALLCLGHLQKYKTTAGYQNHALLQHIEHSLSPEVYLQRYGLVPIFKSIGLWGITTFLDILIFLVRRSLTNILRLVLSQDTEAVTRMLDPSMSIKPDKSALQAYHYEGETILHKWAQFGPGAEDMLDLLLAHGAKVDQRDLVGRTAFMVAHQYGHVREAQLLLLVQRGANVNAQDAGGQTAIHNMEFEDLRNHFDAEYDLSLRDKHGRTALEYHMEQGSPSRLQTSSLQDDDLVQQICLVFERYAIWALHACTQSQLPIEFVCIAKEVLETVKPVPGQDCMLWWWEAFYAKSSDLRDVACAELVTLRHIREKLKTRGWHPANYLGRVLMAERTSKELKSFIEMSLNRVDHTSLAKHRWMLEFKAQRLLTRPLVSTDRRPRR